MCRFTLSLSKGDQMLTFSSICDRFVEAEGFTKKECRTDAEAKQYASAMSYDSATYPVVYFKSDTTGEKVGMAA